jgi:tetratricopeptide (TPR) repeat protein
MDLIVAAGTVLGGRYALGRELGRGGMATVFLAEDLRQRRRVAIKILRPDVAVALGPERFLREIEIAARLSHPHILPLHDSGEIDGLLFYVMPYVEGESLRERLARDGSLPLEEALGIAREVADALAYAHARNVVHRDIKPGNVLLQAGHAVVADFGVARAISAAADERVTGTGLVVGTPVYMSPEQASGEPIDGRTDVYALGCMTYEMLAGQPPFVGATPQQVIARHLAESPPALRALRPGVPPPVVEAIEKALGKRPEERFADAGEFADALRTPGQWEPAGRPRRRVGRWALGAAVVVGAVAGVGLLRRPDVAAAPPAIVVLPFDGEETPADTPRAQALFSELVNWVPGLRATPPDTALPAGRRWHDVPLPRLLARARGQGGRYLLTGTVLPDESGRKVAVDLYAVATGERLSHVVDTATGPGLEGAVGRLAADVVRTVARREGLELGSAEAVLAATNVLPAVGHLLQGQERFWSGDLDGAAGELGAAVAADSSCGLAYLRLSVVQAWRHDFPAALAAADEGLRRADALAPRWVQLLQAQRYLVLGYGDSAIATYQSAVLDDRDDIDGWFGLGEALFHYAGFSGASPRDARPAFERVVALDSAFAPIYNHLVVLAVYAGDRRAATTYLAHVPAGQWSRPANVAEVGLRFGGAAERTAALAALRTADRKDITEAIIVWSHGGFDLRLADTAATFLLGGDRVPDDRLRAAQYRLATQAALGSWSRGLAGWDSVAGAAPAATIDAWLILASLAGYPVGARAAPMFDRARSDLEAGRTPDFTLPPWSDLRQGFEALVYRAAVEGDSAEAAGLLRRIERAPPAPPSEPGADALAWSLRARLALLAADSGAAIEGLTRAVARIPEVHTANYPLTAVAPQRALLARLLLARGDTAGAARWRHSFTASWSVADLFYRAGLDSLGGMPLPRSRSTP